MSLFEGEVSDTHMRSTVKSEGTDPMAKFFRQTRLFHLVLGIALIPILLAACGNNGTTTPTATPTGTTTVAPVGGKGCTKIGLLLPEMAHWDNQQRPILMQKIQAIAGVTVDYYNAQGDAAQQQSQADAALSKGDCILVVAPQDALQAASIVARAKARKVPVIAYDRLIQSKDLNFYVSFDAVAVGQLQGQYIVDHYRDYIQGTNKNVAMINGSQTDSIAFLTRQGALNKLRPLYDSLTLKLIIDQFTPGGNPDTARTEMEGVLTAQQNNLQIAYVANDDMANAVIAALKTKRLNGRVLVTGQDATVAGLQNILTGDQAMTVYKPIQKEAQGTADLIQALHDGSDPQAVTKGATVMTADGAAIPSVLEMPIAVDKTNIQTTVIADNFVTVADICTGLPKGTSGICP
jgi:D-xylose transport system substrate-binding protein